MPVKLSAQSIIREILGDLIHTMFRDAKKVLDKKTIRHKVVLREVLSDTEAYQNRVKLEKDLKAEGYDVWGVAYYKDGPLNGSSMFLVHIREGYK